MPANHHASGPRRSIRGIRTGCASADCACNLKRRQFIKLAGLGTASLAAIGSGLSAVAGPFEPKDVADHFVPADKKLDPKWVAALFARGEPTFFSGPDLKMIAMPVGGICAGQLYLGGDGRLTHWDIFNQHIPTGNGATNYQAAARGATAIKQGFALRVQAGGKSLVRCLDREGFPGVRFRGEYPIGLVEYPDRDFPVSVLLEAFSPFIPLASADSALPATVMHFTLKNTSGTLVEATLAGWLENGVCRQSGEILYGKRRNRLVKNDRLTMIVGSAGSAPPPAEPRPPIVLADFEGGSYGDWTAEGEALGNKPAAGTLPGQQPVGGFLGKGLVNTYLPGDQAQGKLTSPLLKIDRPFICFLIGGGNQAGKTCVNLLVEGKVARTATGRNQERLAWHTWNVRDLAGKEARIEIVDHASGPWGHINVDQIELRDIPPGASKSPLEQQPDFGTMGLALLGGADGVHSSPAIPDGPLPAVLFADQGLAAAAEEEKPFGQALCGALGKTLRLEPGQQAQVTFVVAWCFPNRPERGNYYATRLSDAAAVAQYVAENFDRLARYTRLWRDTWYDSSLPYWLLDRLFAPVSTLATSTCQWWANGRFWAWEGVGCCPGTCAHVWNYEHAMARLFPDLERTVRQMQDFGAGFVPATGAVLFRGENWKLWAGDSQGGTVLKAYREHQCSPTSDFLKRNWPRIRKATEFLIREDGNGDGLIEGSQHNTYDINFFGPNTMVGSLYLGALRAAEEMARELGDAEFAATCRRVFDDGRRNTVQRLFNGEYFIQVVDLKEHPKHQYADGCLADQLFGQGWGHQVDLGYLYPEEKVRAALAAIWKYNWAPDVGPQNAAHPPQRWFARPGEAGLFTCTWPKSKHLGPDSVLYRDEVWTGIEYQVAGHMVWEGMLTEALAICRGVHERYHPARHNPWNEVECGDHYARAMASYGVLLALCGFQYHGPKGHIGFAPRITPDDFRAAFTAAEGWGTFAQRQDQDQRRQTARIEVRYGKLLVRTLGFQLPAGAKLQRASVSAAGRALAAEAKQDGRRVTLSLAEPASVAENQTVEVEMALLFPG